MLLCVSMNFLQQRSSRHTYSLWVRQWTQPVVVLLSRRVPQPQVDWFAIYHNISWVIVKSETNITMSTTLQNTLQYKIKTPCSCPQYHTTQFTHFLAPWYSECLVMPWLRQLSTCHHEGSTVGSRFTRGLHSRISGHKSNCCKMSVIKWFKLR